MSKLKKLRIENNMTLNEIANYLECTKQTYWNYERGIRKIPLEIAFRLSTMYQKSIEEIFLDNK